MKTNAEIEALRQEMYMYIACMVSRIKELWKPVKGWTNR